MMIRLDLFSRSLLYFLLLAVTFSVGGCQDKAETGPKSVLRENVEAFRNEDLGAVKKTMHSESPVYSGGMFKAEKLFAMYDIKYSIEEMKVISRSEQDAKIRMVMIRRGPVLKDDKVTTIQTLKKEDGQWKVWNTEKKNRELLDTD